MDRLKLSLAAGTLAGTVAALLMTLVLLVLRSQFGVPAPSELVGDRIAPTLSVDTFVRILDWARGYNNLKQIGVGSVIVGQIVVGTLGGLFYAWTIRRGARQSALDVNVGASKQGSRFVIVLVGTLWLLSLILWWPVLGTHYYGLPSGRATLMTAFSLLVGYSVYGLAVIVFYRILTVSQSNQATAIVGRRAILIGGIGAVIAAAAALVIRRLYRIATFSYDGTEYKGNDVQFVTPNTQFYVVTKNVIDPQVNPDLWRLEVTGLIERPRAYSFQELTGLPAITQETTLMCISNQVGGGLMSNAVWKGVPLRSLLDASGPQTDVTEIVLHAVDNYTDTIPLTKAMDPTTLVVYEMNGTQLPFNHGYPVRLIVPGLFGEKSVKWITRIEMVAQDVKGFYERQGWGPDFTIPTHSRFDGPDFSQPIPLGRRIPLKGVAFAGNRGISRVEVSFDDGKQWSDAKIVIPGTRLTWALWNYDWNPERAGEYQLRVRARDGEGALQIKEDRGTVPHGATGYHMVAARVVT